VRWNLRWVAANADIWRASDFLAACQQAGFSPSLSKVASWWNTTPTSIRLSDLDMICAALHCAVADLLETEPANGADGDSPSAEAGNATGPPPA
jgi:DNA-binding Xre family transcriptional regulator